MAKTIIGISLEENILIKIDEKRGLIPRSRYVAQILAANLGVQDRVSTVTPAAIAAQSILLLTRSQVKKKFTKYVSHVLILNVLGNM